jgi:DNA-binding GntR family transcriptional regulator
VPNKGPVIRDLTAAEARELYRIREMLEGLSARMFAESRSPEAMGALDAALAAVRDAYAEGDPKAILDAKNRYYAAIHDGMESGILREMLSIVLDRVWRWRALGLSHPNRSAGRSEESIANLAVLTEAIREGDGDRAEAAARHEARSAAAEVILLLERTGREG